MGTQTPTTQKFDSSEQEVKLQKHFILTVLIMTVTLQF